MSELFIEEKKIDKNIEIYEVFLHSQKLAVFLGSSGKRNAKLFVAAFSQFHDIPNYTIKDIQNDRTGI